MKELIEKMLNDLKKVGIDRRQVENDLEYAPFYVDQMIARGGNTKFLKRITRYHHTKTSSKMKGQPHQEENKTAAIETDAADKSSMTELCNSLAQTIKVLVSTNNELTSLLKLEKTNSSGAKGNQPDFSTRLVPILYRIAQAGVNRSWWKTVDDALEDLGKFAKESDLVAHG